MMLLKFFGNNDNHEENNPSVINVNEKESVENPVLPELIEISTAVLRTAKI